jgi:hypothetical protein
MFFTEMKYALNLVIIKTSTINIWVKFDLLMGGVNNAESSIRTSYLWNMDSRVAFQLI